MTTTIARGRRHVGDNGPQLIDLEISTIGSTTTVAREQLSPEIGQTIWSKQMLEIVLAQERMREALRVAELRRLARERQQIALARSGEKRMSMMAWAWNTLRSRWPRKQADASLPTCPVPMPPAAVPSVEREPALTR